jgi:uncharacterized protein (DUF924 family)
MSLADDLLAFWFEGAPDTWRQAWFVRDDAFDAAIAERFGAVADAAAAGAHDALAATPQGTLALMLLLDQFPRNLHRGTARAFAADAHARAIARAAIAAQQDRALGPLQRVFLYMPFEHGEAIEDQDLSVALFEGLRDTPLLAAPDSAIDYAWRHRAVIARFGRFPHRNAALGRESTAKEAAFLAAGGGF